MKRLFSLFLIISSLKAQGIIIPRNKIDVKIKAILLVDTINGYFKFEYKIKSLPQSEQKIWLVALILSNFSDTLCVFDKFALVPEWKGIIKFGSAKPWIPWGPLDSTHRLLPGDSLLGLSIKTYLFPLKRFLLPDISDFYIEGYAPPPSFPVGDVPDSIPGYDDLTPYGPGKVYKTVGPGPLPPGWWEYDSTVYFVSDSGFYHLIDRVNKCFEQNWLKEKAKENLIRMIERSLKHYQNNRIEESKRVLNQVISYLKKERGEVVLDEAFYILYYRTRFVRDHLWWPAK